MSAIDPRTPVLVGRHTFTNRLDDPARSAVELMAIAARGAADDAGAPAVLDAVDWLAVPHGTWRHANAPGAVAAAIGASKARTFVAALGVPQITLVTRALRDIRSGAIDVALVVGGEAAAHRGDRVTDDTTSGTPDEVVPLTDSMISAAEIAAGLVAAPMQYALIERARQLALGRTPAEHDQAVAELWSRFSSVAATNPYAWNRTPLDAAVIATPGPKNRPIALPYLKWHCSQMNIDQATALVLCSAEAATRLGVPSDRWVFPIASGESHVATPVSARLDPARCAAYSVIGAHLERVTGRAPKDMELIDLYSCFPAAVQAQMDAFGMDPSSTPTLTGGMSFSGGPMNNYVLVAAAAVAGAVRGRDGALGLSTAVSGMITKQGAVVWSPTPIADPQYVDVTDEVRTQPVAPLDDTITGTVRPVTWTVLFGPDRADPTRDKMAPGSVVAVVEDDRGARTVVTCRDAAVLAAVAAGEALPAAITVRDGATFVV
jgi:acetyl-CoA C-acetyltransferase